MNNGKKVKRTGSLIKLKPEYEERYIILHKHTFPGVLDRIYKSNIRNYSIFLEDGLLFSYYEYIGKDYESDMAAMADETTQDWWKLTDPMQAPLFSRKEGEWWAEMETLQHFDENVKPYNSVRRFAFRSEMKEGSEIFIEELFKDFDRFIPYYNSAHIQNHSVFHKDRMIFTYFEYAGTDLMGDSEKVLSHQSVKEWNKEFDKHISFPWEDMKEVFHTD